MPIYQFQCEPCSYGEEKFVWRFEDEVPCPTCATPMEHVWALGTRHDGTSIFPYVTKNLSGFPIEIKSARHLRELEKQYNCHLRDDKSYIDEEMLPARRETRIPEGFIQEARERGWFR